MEIPNDFSCYVSAPTSPGRCSPEDMYFYSVPTSPRMTPCNWTPSSHSNPPFGCHSTTHGDHYSTPVPLMPYQDAINSKFVHEDDFEFETSKSFNLDHDVVENETNRKFKEDYSFLRKQHQQPEQRQRGGSLPTMAFADELFCDGKVMPPMTLSPLKLPPRLQRGNDKYGNGSSAPSSPGSPSFMLKLPFAYRRLWNDDFDPFMVALKAVKKDKKGKAKANNHNLMGLNDQPNMQTGLLTPIHHSGSSLNKMNQASDSPSGKGEAGPPKSTKQVWKSHPRLREPKGLEFARQVRLIQMGYEKCGEPNMKTLGGPIVEVAEIGRETKETKGQKIKWLLLSPSVAKVNEENVVVKKPTFLRRLIFKSGRPAHCNGQKNASQVSQLTKMTLVHYKPRLLLCMGYKARFAK